MNTYSKKNTCLGPWGLSRDWGTSGFLLVEMSGRHSGAAGRAAASQHQTPGFEPDLGCCLCAVCTCYLYPPGFPRGVPVSSHILTTCGIVRNIGLCKLPLACREWMRKWDYIALVMLCLDSVSRWACFCAVSSNQTILWHL